MSATPHNGKEADFQLFMGLLDADRFEGRFREGVHKADVSDMMRRLTKEELLPLRRHAAVPRAPGLHGQLRPLAGRGRPLPSRSPTYVREEMNRADRSGDGKRAEQRRLRPPNSATPSGFVAGGDPSVPGAPAQAAGRAAARGEACCADRCAAPLPAHPSCRAIDADDLDDAPGDEAEALEEQIADQATAARPSPNLRPRSSSSRTSKSGRCG